MALETSRTTFTKDWTLIQATHEINTLKINQVQTRKSHSEIHARCCALRVESDQYSIVDVDWPKCVFYAEFHQTLIKAIDLLCNAYRTTQYTFLHFYALWMQLVKPTLHFGLSKRH